MLNSINVLMMNWNSILSAIPLFTLGVIRLARTLLVVGINRNIFLFRTI